MSAVIRVRTRCTCGETWFRCVCSEEVATYTGEGHPWEIEDLGVPTPEFVAYVVKLEPGMDLIYRSTPAYLAAAYARALQTPPE